MRHLIARALRTALRFALPARGRHRRRPPVVICAPTGPVSLTVPKRVICAPVRPVSLADLRMTAPPVLVRRYLRAFEQMTPDQQEAARVAHITDMDARWRKIIEFELQREANDHRRRRAALFAAEMDLPDPLHWLDEVTTGEPHTLTGKRVA